MTSIVSTAFLFFCFSFFSVVRSSMRTQRKPKLSVDIMYLSQMRPRDEHLVESLDLCEQQLDSSWDEHRNKDGRILSFSPDRIVFENRQVTNNNKPIEKRLPSNWFDSICAEVFESEHKRIQWNSIIHPIITETEKRPKTFEISDRKRYLGTDLDYGVMNNTHPHSLSHPSEQNAYHNLLDIIQFGFKRIYYYRLKLSLYSRRISS